MGCGFLQEQSQISGEYSFLTSWPGLRNWTCPALHFSIFLSGLLYPSFPSQQSQPCLPKQRHSSERACKWPTSPFISPQSMPLRGMFSQGLLGLKVNAPRKHFVFWPHSFCRKLTKFPHHIPHYKNGFLLWLAKVWDWRREWYLPVRIDIV